MFNLQCSMNKNHHHHHRDDASRFKERNLNAIVLRRKLEKWGKILLTIVAIGMIIALITVYVL